MPDGHNSRGVAYTGQSSSSAVLETPWIGYERVGRLPVQPKSPAPPVLAAPEIWGQFNNYRSTALTRSAMIHAVVLGLILATSLVGQHVVQQAKPREIVTLIAPSPDSYTLPTAKKEVSGGGGGGDRDHIQAPKGRLPKLAVQQIAPPQIVLHNEKPKLAVEPTVVVPPQVHLATNSMPNLGVPTAAPMPAAPPSNGTGSGGGIGSGSNGGVGVGHGSGVGEGTGGGIGGGIYKVGGGISAPKPVSTPDPNYTDEARKAKTQGTCVLGLIVDENGQPRDIRVVRGLGNGLDEKAIESVKQWKFEPALKDGKPVKVQIRVEVAFKLY
jgi:periplasmic protein TonB